MFPFQDYKTVDIDSTNVLGPTIVHTLSKRSLVSYEDDVSVTGNNNNVTYSLSLFSSYPIIIVADQQQDLFNLAVAGGSVTFFEYNTLTLEAGTQLKVATFIGRLKGKIHILELPDVI